MRTVPARTGPRTLRAVLVHVVLTTRCLGAACPQVDEQVTTLDGTTKAGELARFIDVAVEQGAFRGAIIVVEGRRVIFERAAGDAETGLRATTVTAPFYLASISKQFTATAVMLLEEEGKLAYDDPVSRFFPDFPEWAGRVTVAHLLNHTSGLGGYPDASLSDDGLTGAGVIAHLAKLPEPEFDPGERYLYSNSGYVLLARIVERVTGTSFREFTASRIFEPLGMSSAVFYDESRPDIPEPVRGYDRYGRLDETTMFANGAGGMYASARDLVRWHHALFDRVVLQQQTLDRAWTVTTLNDGSASDYGFGWHVHDRDEGKVLHHTGSKGGFRHFVFADLAGEHVVIMLTNGGDAFPLGPMATAVTNILRGRPAELPQPALVDHLFAFAQASPAGLRAEAARVRAQEPDRFRVSEDGLNELGYTFMETGRLTEALGAFAAAIDAYPDSANAYDSYAEALMTNGDYGESIVNYTKSLELDPNNDGAREMLKRLRGRDGG